MTSAPDPRYLLTRRRTLLVMTGVVATIFLASISHLMVLVAIPPIVGDLGGLDRFAWVLTAYFLGSTVTIAIWGKLSDQYGRRPLLALAICCFLVGAAVCALAPTMEILIAGRALQGIGSGGMVPIAIATTADIMAPRERGKWVAYQSTGAVASSLAGPAFGGWISDVADWRIAFAVMIPIGLGALAIVWFGLNIRTRRTSHTIDYAGSALLGGSLLSGLFATTLGGKQYAWNSPLVVGLFAGCAALLAAFVWWERRVPEPIIPLELFRNRTFAAAQVAMLGIGCAHFTSQTYIPLLVQGALGRSATSAGAILTPFMLTLVVSGAVFGQILSRTGRYRPLLIGAPLLVFVGFVLLGRLSVRPASSDIVRSMVVVAVGLACIQTFQIVVQNSVPQRMMGVVAGANQLARTIGGTVMLSVLGAIMTSRLHTELEERLPAGTLTRVSVDQLISGNQELSGEVAARVQEAFGAAIPALFTYALPVIGIAFVAAFFVERRELRRTVAEQPDTPGKAA